MTLEMNHVGITVGDLDAAVAWYHEVFDLKVLVGVGTHTLETAGGSRREDVFGPRWREMRLAHLGTPGGVGIELFQFVDPPVEEQEDPFRYWRQGIFHVCFTVDDLEASLTKVRANGGTVRTQVHEVHPGTSVAYCQDPWGTIIELSSRSYAHIVGRE